MIGHLDLLTRTGAPEAGATMARGGHAFVPADTQLTWWTCLDGRIWCFALRSPSRTYVWCVDLHSSPVPVWTAAGG